MAEDLKSKKRFTLSGNNLAYEYGFNSHWEFVDFIMEYFPELVEELEENGWAPDTNRYYLPNRQLIIEKHLPKSNYRKTQKSDLARAYGYSDFIYLLRQMQEQGKCIDELEKYGWDESRTKLLPIWIDIIVKHLGIPACEDIILK